MFWMVLLWGDFGGRVAGGAGADGSVGGDAEPMARAAYEAGLGVAALGGRGDDVPASLARGVGGYFEELSAFPRDSVAECADARVSSSEVGFYPVAAWAMF